MKNSGCTVIRFDYGGYYSKKGDDIEWNPKEDDIYTLVMKGSLEKFTYCELVDRICRKITVDKSTTRLKLSYIPLLQEARKRHTYILDDEDLLGYLMEGDNNHCRDVLHVEVVEGVLETHKTCEQIPSEQIPREDLESGVYVRIDETASGARVTDDMDALNRKHDLMLDNDQCEEFGNVDDDDLFVYVQTNDVVNAEWEDGIGLTIGQEFESRREVQDLVDKASHLNCFEVVARKSEPRLYVLKCRASCCQWSLRVVKLKTSDRFSVRTYNKIHTCSRVTTSTRRNKKRGTPRLVASVLHENYPGVIDTPTPKIIMDLVQERYGASVSYSTALRGKNLAKELAASDVHGSSEES